MAIGNVHGQKSGVQSVANVKPDKAGNVPVEAKDVGALPTTGGTMTGSLKVMPPVDDQDASSKKYVDEGVVVATNSVVPPSAWTLDPDAESTEFTYVAKIAIPRVTDSMVPMVSFSEAGAMSGDFSPVAKTYNGGVQIYATAKQVAPITVPNIIVWRVAK